MIDFNKQIAKAVKHFWKVRTSQYTKQTSSADKADAGLRGAVTGGKHLDGFIDLLADILSEAGLPDSTICKKSTTLPGYFRPTKDWDLVVVADEHLVASIEFKAHVGPSLETILTTESRKRLEVLSTF